MIEVIQLYPYLKNGEIWRDIEEEFEDTNTKATSDDKPWMATWIKASRDQTHTKSHRKVITSIDMKVFKIQLSITFLGYIIQ